MMAAESSGTDSTSRTSLWGAVVYPKLSALWKTGFGCDMTIVCQDGSVSAPSCLLAILSPKMRALIESSTDNSVTFANISIKFWEVLLDLAYSGKLQDHLVYNLSSDFYISLVVQHSFNMTDILALYKHLFSIDDDGSKSLEFSENLFFDEESAVEYFGTDEERLTTPLSGEVETELRDYFDNAKTKVQMVERTEKNFIGQCESCNDVCIAVRVQCCLCGALVQTANGFRHMFNNHRFSPSAVWPYNCFVNEKMASMITGKRIEKKNNPQNRSGNAASICMYKCLLCDYVIENEARFHDHFLTHGFFPEACGYCGDVFSEVEMKKNHMKYCQSNIVVKFECFGDELMGEVDYESDAGHASDYNDADDNNDDFDTERTGDGQAKTKLDMKMAYDPAVQRSVEEFEEKCLSCLEKCAAENVMCLFCGDIVANNVKHMVMEHSESIQATDWIYTCIFDQDMEKETSEGQKTSNILVKKSWEEGEMDMLQCMYCGMVYKDEKMMLLHFRAAHGISKVFYCKHCSTGLKNEKLQASHELFCGGTGYVQCESCQVYFENIEQLQEHTQRHGGCWKPNTTQDGMEEEIQQEEMDTNDSYLGVEEADNTAEDDQSDDETTSKYTATCVKCGLHCDAELVQCFYCQKIVENSPKHMDEDHPFIPVTSLWVYTCDTYKIQGNSDKDSNDEEEEEQQQQSVPSWLLFIKRRKTSKRHEYECQHCLKVFPVVEKVIKHMRAKHKVGLVKTCDICKTGFGGAVYHKDHYHFCSGGGLMHCDICDEMIGTYQNLLLHNVTCVQNQNNLIDGTFDDIPEKSVGLFKTALQTQQDTNMNLENRRDIPWMPVCYHCGVDCNQKEEVKCIYCNKIVEKSSSHMEKYHPFTPKTSLWVYTCNFNKATKVANKDYIVCYKEPGPIDGDFGDLDRNDLSRFHYCCNKCDSKFEDLCDLKMHLSREYNILKAKFCMICETGFEKIDVMKGHQFYCRGENLMKCEICSKLVGSYRSYFDHVFKYHPDQRESISIYKGPENSKSFANEPNEGIAEQLSNARTIKQMQEQSILDVSEPETSQSIPGDVSDEGDNVLHVEIVLKDQTGKEKVQRITVQNDSLINKKKDKSIVQTPTKKVHEVIQTKMDNRRLTEQIKELVGPTIQGFFEEETSDKSDSPNAKSCFTCGGKCKAEMVKCMYCCKVVPGDSGTHMTHNHPSMSNTAIWAVNCSYFGEDDISPMISEMYSIKKSADSKNNSMQHCLICDDAVFTDTKQLCAHIAEVHRLKYVYFCNVCNSGFRYAKKRLSHEQFCSGGKILECKACHKVVGNWVLALSHYNSFHKGEEFTEGQSEEIKPVNSEIVNVQLDNKYFGIDEQFVVLNRSRGTNNSLLCIYCDFACTAKQVRCLYCKEMVDVENKEKHLKDVHPLTPASSLWPVQCKFLTIEGRNMAGKPYILSNKYISDEGTSYYNCELCKADSFTSIGAIENHMNNVHDKNAYICIQCGLGMASRKGKKVHEYFCTGNDVLQCSKCHKILRNILYCLVHKRQCDKKQKIIRRLTADISVDREEMEYSDDDDTNLTEADKGKYGYQIYCGNCEGSCKAPRVRCGLCSETVFAKDIHMKVKHPYSPCTRWVVFCKFSKIFKSKSLILGERIPCVEPEKILKEKCIPSRLPSYYRCNTCTRIFSEVGMLRNHIIFGHGFTSKTAKKKELMSMCNTCNMIFCNREMHLNHSNYCIGKLHSCPFCNETFSAHKMLATHKKENHQTELNQKGRLYIPEGTELTCAETDCGFKTFDYMELKKHNKEIHQYLNHQLYQICRFCYKVFRLSRDREIHQQQDHLNGQRCLCETCGKDMETPTQLERHVKYYHQGERENSSILHKYHRPRKICSICGYVGTTTSALKHHIKVTHEKKFEECHICGKTFKSTESLKCHLNSHNENKNYSCPYCTYKAYRGHRVNDHVRKVHPGSELPFKKRVVIHNYLESPMGPISKPNGEDQAMEDDVYF